MYLLQILLILFTGVLASKYFLRKADFLARVGIVIFFSLAVVPFISLNYSLFCGKYISDKLVTVVSLVTIAFFAFLQFLSRDKTENKVSLPENNDKQGMLVLFICLLCALFSFYYYSNREFLFSLGSYLIKGDAGCFLMQTFKTYGPLNPGKIPDLKIYEIICTPGNILFTSAILPILKLCSFKAVYVLFNCMIFIFVYLIINKLVKNRIVGIAAALFSVLNPYMLSVEVLDRNVMAFAVTAVLFYLILEHPKEIFLHGLVFGILSGLGLRFLPFLFVIPVCILYFFREFGLKNLIIFFCAFFVTFTFNIPHMFFQGLNSLGETQSTPALISFMLKNWFRTPFLPFPNIIFYLLNIFSYFGYLVSGLILLGALRSFRLDKKIFYACFSWFAAVLFVLSYQRNWLESDKARIMLEAFLPLCVFFAYGLEEVFRNRRNVRKYVLFIACCLVPVLFVRLCSDLEFNQDQDFFKKKYLYQRENRAYYLLTKRKLENVKLYPDYARLFQKLEIKDRPKEESLILSKLFPKGSFPEKDKFKVFYLDWQRYFYGSGKGVPEKSTQEYVYLRINFDKLSRDLNLKIEVLERADICAIDLEDEENLFDVYYADLETSLQNEVLPVCVILNKDEINFLGRFYIDLNAFVSFGKDDGSFDRINSVNFKAESFSQKKAFDSGMGSFPLVTEGTSVTLRVPKDLEIVIRNWFINEKGAPYKIDSWRLKHAAGRNWKAEFFYNEPESYL